MHFDLPPCPGHRDKNVFFHEPLLVFLKFLKKQFTLTGDFNQVNLLEN